MDLQPKDVPDPVPTTDDAKEYVDYISLLKKWLMSFSLVSIKKSQGLNACINDDATPNIILSLCVYS